jgi:hypothetical protein
MWLQHTHNHITVEHTTPNVGPVLRPFCEKYDNDVTWLFQLDLFIIQPMSLTITEHLLDEI